MKPIHWVILGGAVLLLGGYLAWDYLVSASVTPASLAARALTASDQKERVEAARGLAMITQFHEASPHLRRVAKETKDPEVLIITLNALTALVDTGSLPIFFKSLENPEEEVRQTAVEGLLQFYSGSLPDNLEYEVDDPP